MDYNVEWGYKVRWITKWYSTNVDMNTNMQGIVCLGKIMFICNKQHSSNIWDLKN